MVRSYINYPILIIESFISISLSLAVMLGTRVVLGSIKGIEAFLTKLHLFDFVKSKSQLSVIISILITILALLIGAEFQSLNQEHTNILIIIMFLIGLPLLMNLCEFALSIPSSLAAIKSPANYSNFELWFGFRMRNPLDVVWIRPIIILSILIIPSFIGILFPSLYNSFTLLIYATIFSIGFNAINAFEHTNSHNRLFKNKNLKGKDKIIFNVLEIYCEFVLNFMFARIPNWYRIQHVIIHHVEDNGIEDTQSTLPYDRSSFIDFTRCALRFTISGLFSIDILKYLIKRKRKKVISQLAIGMIFYYALLIVVLVWNWMFFVTIICFRIIGQIISTLGFLHEHGMIDILEPNNIYRNSLHFITTENSHASLGDDAHIEHHLNQGSHWSNYINKFNQNVLTYANERALGFKDSPGGLSKYYYYIWRKDFTNLASLFVIFENKQASYEEVALILKDRSQPFFSSRESKIFKRVDKALGWFASNLLPWWQENKP